MVGAAAGRVFLWRLVRGFCCARCHCHLVLFVLLSPYLDSNPARCRVRLLIGSLELFGWGSIPLLSARVPHVLFWWRFFTSFGASKRRLWDSCLFLVSATSGRLSASPGWARPVRGVPWWFPFPCGWAVISALRAARERAPCGVWLLRVVALVAYAVSGCPCGCAWLVRLRGFPCVCGGWRTGCCVACFTRVVVDGAGYGVLRYWCWVSQLNRSRVFDWRRENVCCCVRADNVLT